MATKKMYTSAAIKTRSLSDNRAPALTRVHPVEETSFADFSPAQAIRAGIGAGAVLGIIVGGTLWTHSPDALHVQIALAVLVFSIVVGGLLGKLVASIKAD